MRSILARLGSETGQDMVEWAGVLVIVAVIIVAVVSLGLGGTVTRSVTHSVDCVLSSCSSSASSQSARGGTAGGSPGSGPASTDLATSTPPRTGVTLASNVVTGGGTSGTSNPCPAGDAPADGPYLPGLRPCASTSTGQIDNPCPSGETLPAGQYAPGGCVALPGSSTANSDPNNSSALNGTSVPTAPAPGHEIYPDFSNATTCNVGYDFHDYEGQGYCAWAPDDPDPSDLSESPVIPYTDAYGQDNGTCPSNAEQAVKQLLALPKTGVLLPGNTTPQFVEIGSGSNAHWQDFPYGQDEYNDFLTDFNDDLEKLKGLWEAPGEALKTRAEAEERIEELALQQADAQAARNAPAYGSPNDGDDDGNDGDDDDPFGPDGDADGI